MISQTFIDALRHDLQVAHDEVARVMIEGGITTFETYQYAVGQLAGLRAARESVDALVKKANAGEIV